MSHVYFAPDTSAALEPAVTAAIREAWTPGEPNTTLAVATLPDLGWALKQDPEALFLLAQASEMPPATLASLGIPFDVVFFPLSARDLKRRVQWLSQRLGCESGRDEARLRRLATLGQLAATVAHEIGNSLSYAFTNVDYLVRQTEAPVRDDEDCLSAAQDARDGIRQALDTSRMVLDLARNPALVPVPLDVNAIVERTLKICRAQAPRGVVFLSNLRGIPPALADKTALVQVITNLILNGIQAAGAGGTLRVETTYDARHILLSVSDSGPGLSEQAAAQLFQPFSTSGKPGSGNGLGLAASRSMLDAMGATIEVTTGALGGAEFRICLRRAPVQNRTHRAGEQSSAAPTSQ